MAGWSAYLANESTNNWKGWFDAGAGVTVQSAAGGTGGVLEGTVDLAQQFGSVPAVIYVAFAAYGTNDGGALIASAQVPSLGQWRWQHRCDRVRPVPTGAARRYELRRRGELRRHKSVCCWALGSQSSYQAQYPNCSFTSADINGDGAVNYADINPFVVLLSSQ